MPFTIIIIIMIIHFTRPHKYYKHPVVTNCTITYSTVTHTGVAQYCSHPYRRSTILQPPIPVQHNSTVTHTGAAQFCSHPYRCSTILQSPIPLQHNTAVTHIGAAQFCSHPYRCSTILQSPIPVQHNSTVTHTGAAQYLLNSNSPRPKCFNIINCFIQSANKQAKAKKTINVYKIN